ncbi:TPA: hypothetical protein QDB08_002688 [Burkholderia vietnamiensis]|uniref:hypothetical protein n=1 Tax=Burkholderia vietnamiensis TaxID=60552 RepID=UPI0015943733|nr:hypothetical protein [Burkholderia vietnamiensis]HDR9009718.1 hypothetical protein [Burkholderia vietnamiensis]HDR9013763.1 hypothetical protein [Burkholderia vietnamiensis]
MDEVKEVFFAPSIEWFKTKAKQLRLHIGWDVKQYYASLTLLARIYGFASWLEFLEYHSGAHAYVTFWDSGLDKRTFEERRYMQTTALMSALQIGAREAVKILDEVLVSSQREAMSDLTERNGIQEFGFALQEVLDEHRESPHALNVAPARPVVTYKKRHRMPPDVVPSRVQ